MNRASVLAAVEAVLRGDAPWAIVCGDGLALCDLLTDKAVDHVITDPPYDEETHENARTTKDGGRPVDIDFAPIVPADVAPKLVRVAKGWTLAFCSLEQIGEYRQAMGKRYIKAGFWRCHTGPQQTGDRPAQFGQGIALAQADESAAIAILHDLGRKRWNGGGKAAYYEGPIDRSPDRVHPTKKPLYLMERIIEDFTQPGDVVLDAFCGEGTTLEACVRLGRRVIGCELDPKYYQAAVRRVQAAREQRTLWRAEKAPAKQVDLFGVASAK